MGDEAQEGNGSKLEQLKNEAKGELEELDQQMKEIEKMKDESIEKLEGKIIELKGLSDIDVIKEQHEQALQELQATKEDIEARKLSIAMMDQTIQNLDEQISKIQAEHDRVAGEISVKKNRLVEKINFYDELKQQIANLVKLLKEADDLFNMKVQEIEKQKEALKNNKDLSPEVLEQSLREIDEGLMKMYKEHEMLTTQLKTQIAEDIDPAFKDDILEEINQQMISHPLSETQIKQLLEHGDELEITDAEKGPLTDQERIMLTKMGLIITPSERIITKDDQVLSIEQIRKMGWLLPSGKRRGEGEEADVESVTTELKKSRASSPTTRESEDEDKLEEWKKQEIIKEKAKETGVSTRASEVAREAQLTPEERKRREEKHKERMERKADREQRRAQGEQVSSEDEDQLEEWERREIIKENAKETGVSLRESEITREAQLDSKERKRRDKKRKERLERKADREERQARGEQVSSEDEDQLEEWERREIVKEKAKETGVSLRESEIAREAQLDSKERKRRDKKRKERLKRKADREERQARGEQVSSDDEDQLEDWEKREVIQEKAKGIGVSLRGSEITREAQLDPEERKRRENKRKERMERKADRDQKRARGEQVSSEDENQMEDWEKKEVQREKEKAKRMIIKGSRTSTITRASEFSKKKGRAMSESARQKWEKEHRGEGTYTDFSMGMYDEAQGEMKTEQDHYPYGSFITQVTSMISDITSETVESEKPDVEYLKRVFGKALSLGLAEITQVQPFDPIHYLAHWLFKYRYNQEIEEVKQRELEALLAERERIDREKTHEAIEAEAKQAVLDAWLRAEGIILDQEMAAAMAADMDGEEEGLNDYNYENEILNT